MIENNIRKRKRAEALGILGNIGQTLKSKYYYSFRDGNIAKIVGLGFTPASQAVYYIQFPTGDFDIIPVAKRYGDSKFIFEGPLESSVKFASGDNWRRNAPFCNTWERVYCFRKFQHLDLAETAEIIGWGFSENYEIPLLLIRFKKFRML